MDRRNQEIRELKRQLKQAEKDNRIKKIGLIIETVIAITSILSLFKS